MIINTTSNNRKTVKAVDGQAVRALLCCEDLRGGGTVILCYTIQYYTII